MARPREDNNFKGAEQASKKKLGRSARRRLARRAALREELISRAREAVNELAVCARIAQRLGLVVVVLASRLTKWRAGPGSPGSSPTLTTPAVPPAASSTTRASRVKAPTSARGARAVVADGGRHHHRERFHGGP